VLVALACALGVAAPAAASDDPLTFQPFAAYGVGSDPESVAIADVTGDGRNDVLISTSSYFDPENDGKLFVFAQTPDGNLAYTARLATDGPSLGMGLSAGDRTATASQTRPSPPQMASTSTSRRAGTSSDQRSSLARHPRCTWRSATST
jgi:hypothetical protein